ncbi:MAG: Phosphoadenylyl-sulfate reductase [thioredoxin], partial [uncultured Solirubrobacteraceae bacterium]
DPAGGRAGGVLRPVAGGGRDARGGRALRRRPPGARGVLAEGDRGAGRPDAALRARGPDLHARHRRAVPPELRRLAQGRGALRDQGRGLEGRMGRRPLGGRPRPLLHAAQGRAAPAGARERRLLADRAAPRPVARPRRHAGAGLGRPPRALQGRAAGDLDRQGRLELHLHARPALQRAPRPGLRVDRLHALHARRSRPRGPLGGHRQERVRAARL